MNFFRKGMFPIVLGLVLTMGFFSSCEEDLTTIGDGLVGAEAFTAEKQVFDVFAYNRNIDAVRTNKLTSYQLGRYNDPVFGNTQGSVTTQLQLSTYNPAFGLFSQDTENESDADAIVTTIVENETVKEVYLYIPYFPSGTARDRDADGVEDEFDDAPDDPENDSDGDGVSNTSERISGTDPLDSSSVDANLDGKNDSDDVTIIANNFAKKIELDSIYGAIDAPFKLKVEHSTYFLRDLDPNSNFQEAQSYFSSQQFSPDFVSDVLYDSEVSGELVIDDNEILIAQEDDEETVDIDESLTFEKLNPGIRVPLDNQFFQDYILDKEGSSELFTASNFTTFLRGIHLSLNSDDPEGLMLLLDFRQANIVLTYTHDSYDSESTGDDNIAILEKDFRINLISSAANLAPINGNAVNTLNNDDYPSAITEALDTGDNASRIYVKGGAGIFTEINLFEPENGLDIVNQIKAENWIINEANLVFYIDRDQLDMVGGTIEPPRLYLYNTETNAPLYNPATERSVSENLFGRYLNYDGVIEKSGDDGIKYTVKITEHINSIIIRDAENATLGLTLTTNILTTTGANAMLSSGEESFIPVTSVLTPLGTVLYGSNIPDTDPDFEKRLKLEISYTKVD